MRLGVPARTTAIWLILILASFLTWWLGTNDSRDQLSDRVMIAAVVVIAFLKAYLVGMEFMEVRGAPAVLRGLLTGWMGLLAVAVTTLYLA
ncbi:cytochrome C oxidase subunit IV family protein [Mycobacterium sp.]|uniref:cytochrome C oxidase subunit IV family protein n=1 Tax=Mycobacterium sp. TaxID=1785 RepID=UPI003C7897BF